MTYSGFNSDYRTLVELDKNERPLYPPKIISVRIVDNPFDDIVPRITAAEKRAQQLAKEAAQREREEAARKKGAKKYVILVMLHPIGLTRLVI
jgi:peptidyl-prolyl cis-trans isomerase SDCCAG10